MSSRSSAQPATPRAESHPAKRPLLRQKVVVPSASPYPALDARRRPAWWIRLRGLVGMSALVVVLGVLLAVSMGVLLALFAVWMLTALT